MNLRYAFSVLIFACMIDVSLMWGDDKKSNGDVSLGSRLVEKLGYGASGWNVRHMNPRPASFDTMDYDIRHLDIWVTLSPKYETIENLSFYSTLWIHQTGVHFENAITEANFSEEPDAFCFVKWTSYEPLIEDASNDPVIYRVFCSDAADEKDVELSKITMVHEGKEPYYYVPIEDLMRPGKAIYWVEEVSLAGLLQSKSEYFRL